jgi:hypothetical protein
LTATAVVLSATALIMGISPASATPTDPTIPIADPAASTEAAAPAPPATPATITLPLFGAPLTVEITTGPGGVLASVAVNPADSLTATMLKPNRVVFVNEAGTAKVVVNARGGNQKIEARAGSLAEVSGPGGWSGDLFGTGAITTVDFEIVALADGSPDIVNIATSDPTAEIGTVEHETDDDDDGDQEAKVRIRFTDGTQSRTLSIKVEAEVSSDGKAKVKLALSNVKGVSLPAAEVAGAHTWNGVLCDGTAATISYTVAEDGSLSAVSASPEPERMHVTDSKIQVRFTRDERVHIRVRGDDGELKISIDEKIRCHDAPPPSVNTEVAPDAIRPDDDDDDRRDPDRDRGDNNDDGHRGDSDDGHRGDDDEDRDDDDENRGGNGNGGGRDGHRGGDD